MQTKPIETTTVDRADLKNSGTRGENKIRPTQLLIVDDEQNNLTAMKRILSDLDCLVDVATNGNQAMHQFNRLQADVVILDINMPGLDGFEVCARIKKQQSNTLVLLLSGRSSLPDRIKGYKMQADDYMIKPYDPDELLAKVNILIRLSRVQNHLLYLNRDLKSIVQQKTALLLARERQVIVGQMVQGIVHNFNGPLAVALHAVGLASLEFDKFIANCKKNGILEKNLTQKIVRGHDRINDAVMQLTEMTRTLLVSDEDQPRELKKTLDLNALIRKEVRLLKAPFIKKHKVTINLNLGDDLPLIKAKYTDFSQMVYNLVKNACEAMKNSSKRELTISSRNHHSWLTISFADTGPGIPTDDTDQIFSPFFSTKSGKKNKGQIRGLGLFITTRLLTRYEALIAVENTSPRGSEFIIRIPHPEFEPNNHSKV